MSVYGRVCTCVKAREGWEGGLMDGVAHMHIPLNYQFCYKRLCQVDIQATGQIMVFSIAAVGEEMNRRVSIQKIANRTTTILGDFRRGDIFLQNEVLTVFIRILKSNHHNFQCFHIHALCGRVMSITAENIYVSPRVKTISRNIVQSNLHYLPGSVPLLCSDVK